MALIMEQSTQDKTGGAAPPDYYFATFKTLLRHMKPHKLPSRIGWNIFHKFSGADKTRIISSLSFFGLIDERGETTARFSEILAAYGTDLWPSVVRRLLEHSYAPLFQVDLASASPGQFDDRFRSAYPGTDNIRKSMTFFLNAAVEANIEINPNIMENRRSRRGGRPAKVAESHAEASPTATSSFSLLAIFNQDMTDGEQEAFWTLLRYLRRKETSAPLVTQSPKKHKSHKAPRGIDWTSELEEAQKMGENSAQLARRLGVAPGTVRDAAHRRGVVLRTANTGAKGIDWPAELARSMELRETASQVAERLGVTYNTIKYAEKRNGVQLSRTNKSASVSNK